MDKFYLASLLALATLYLAGTGESVSINFRNYTVNSGVAGGTDRAKLQQQQLLQQQLQAVAAAAAAQQKQQQQASLQGQAPVQAQVTPATTPSTTSSVEFVTDSPTGQSSAVQVGPPKWCQVHVYKKSRVTWLEAYRTCRSMGNGTELASIKSEEDYNSLSAKVKEAGSPASVIYWTSGTDLIDEGEFFWMNDGTPVENTYWGAGQPDNHWESEHCIALKRYPHENNYKMTDENCLLAGAFICTQPCKFWV